MKKAACTLLLTCFAAIHLFAQNGAFVSLSGTFGLSSIWSESDNKSDILGSGLELKAGYQFRSNLQLSTGISWLKTGFTNRFDYVFTPAGPEYYESYKFTHLLIPVELGYSFRLGNKFCLIPAINIGISFPLSGHYFSETDNIYEEKFDEQRLNSYNSFTFWAGTSLHLTYDITERIGLTGGFQLNSMVSDFWKLSVTGMGSQMMYILGGDIGIRYRF